MPSGSSSSSSDLEIASSSTSRSAPRPRRAAAPTSSNLALDALPSPAGHPDPGADIHTPRRASRPRPSPAAHAGSARARDGACGSSPWAGAAAQAGAGRPAAAGEGHGKGKAKLIDTIEISSSDDSDDDRLPPPSSSRPRQVAAQRPRVSLPHSSTTHRPGPAPRRSEPAPRSLATLTLSSSDSEDAADMLPQPAAPARPSSSQSEAASETARRAGAQPSGSRTPRAALQVRDAARTMSSPASASSAPSRDAASMPASARKELATASQAQPPPGASRSSSSLGQSALSASSLPRPTAVKPVAKAASTSAPRPSLPSSQPRLPASPKRRARPPSALGSSGGRQARPDSTSTSAQPESAPSANRLPPGILSQYGPAAPSPSASASASRPTAQPVGRPTAASARATSSVDTDVELVRVGRHAVQASSSSEPEHGPARVHLQMRAPTHAVPSARAPLSTPGRSSPRAHGRLERAPSTAAAISAGPGRPEEAAFGTSQAGDGEARAAPAEAAALGREVVAGGAAAAARSASGSGSSAVARGEKDEDEQMELGEQGPGEQPSSSRAGRAVQAAAAPSSAAAAAAALVAERTSLESATQQKRSTAERPASAGALVDRAAAAVPGPARLDSTARAPRLPADAVARQSTSISSNAAGPSLPVAKAAPAGSATAAGLAGQRAASARGRTSSELEPDPESSSSGVRMPESIGGKQEKGGNESEGADDVPGPVGDGPTPAQRALSAQAPRLDSSRSRVDVELHGASASAASAGAARLNTARTSTDGLPPPSAASSTFFAHPTARKSMGSRHAGGARAPSSTAASSRSASPLGPRRGTARKSLGGRQVQALTRSSSSPSSSSTSASDDGGSDSSASSSTGAESAGRGRPERAAASTSLALADASATTATLPPSSAPSKTTARKSTGGRAHVERPSETKAAGPPLTAPTTKRKPPPSPASSATSTDAPQKKRRRYADDIVAESAIKEGGHLGSRRRLRSKRSAVEPVVEQAHPLVLEPDKVVADEMGDQDKVEQIEDKIEKFKLTEAVEHSWNRLIAGPSFDVDAEFDISIQNYVNRRERRWARRHPDEHPLREGYKTLFELMVLEANAKEYSPRESARRPKIRILPPIGQSAHHWSSPPFEFIYTNRVVYSDGICPVQAPGCDCEGNCGTSTNRARCACRKRQIESSRARPGGQRRSGHRDFAYVDGRLDDAVFEEQDPIIECNSECGCGPECINRVVGLRPSVSVDIFHTGKNGWGVRLAPTYKDEAGETHVARVIKRGEPLAIYAGELLRTADAEARNQLVYMITNRTYIYDLDCWTIAEDIRALAPPDTPIQSAIVPKAGAHKPGERAAPSGSGKGKDKKSTPAPVDQDEDDKSPSFSSLYSIDAYNMGNWTRFSNHVCQGFNVAPRPVYIDDFDVSRPLWVYFALRDISPGEEINISYAGETEPDPQQYGYTRAQWKAAADESRRKADKPHRCYCGKPLCRGRMFNHEEASFWARGEGLPGS